MPINFHQLRSILKEIGIPVYRDGAKADEEYPFIIYEFVNEKHKRASSKVWKSLPLYQIAFVTAGIESDLEPLKAKFNENYVEYSQFTPIPYDENDDTITQFITYVRCVNG